MGEETHRYGKMEWVFYIIILPLLFTALLSGVILQFLGFDITGKIASAFKTVTGQHTAQTTTAKPKPGDPAKQLQDAQDKVKTLEKTKQQLEDDLAKKNSELSSLQKQASSPKSTDPQTAGSSSGTTAAPTPPSDPLQDQADIYVQMSTTKAAAILGNLPVTKAKQILSKMTNDQEASILEKMDPVVASKILSP
jgi:flagellar motility protein MotE (MotC chaperone)